MVGWFLLVDVGKALRLVGWSTRMQSGTHAVVSNSASDGETHGRMDADRMADYQFTGDFLNEVLRKRPYIEGSVVHLRDRKRRPFRAAGDQSVAVLGHNSRTGWPVPAGGDAGG